MKFTGGKNGRIVVTIENKDFVRVSDKAISNNFALVSRESVTEIKYPSKEIVNGPTIAEIKRWEIMGEVPTSHVVDMTRFFTDKKSDETELIPTVLSALVNDINYLVFVRKEDFKPVLVDSSLKALMSLGVARQEGEPNGMIRIRKITNISPDGVFQEGEVVAVLMPLNSKPNVMWSVVNRIDWKDITEEE
jgi:hypothetical protein